MRVLFVVFALLPSASGCSLALDLDQFLGADAGGQNDDAGQSDAGPSDAGPSDAGGDEDAATPRDGGAGDGGMHMCTRVSSTYCVVQLAAGADFTCARFQNGKVGCWGSDKKGQFGDGNPNDGSHPYPGSIVSSVDQAIDLSANSDQACALKEDGMVFCWGELVDGGVQHSPFGVRIDGAAQVSVGGLHRCVLTSNGKVFCWGRNLNGEVGVGGASEVQDPVEVQLRLASQEQVTQISAGTNHTCALTNRGWVYCWGSNSHGQLGASPSTMASHTPIKVPDLDDVLEISAGGWHTCARREGEVRCWGNNATGQLGRESEENLHLPPAPVMGLSDAVEIRAGVVHTCARRANGHVMCWGSNDSGRLGIGSTTAGKHPTPTQVVNLQGVWSLEAGESHNCALTDRSAFCWGNNEEGQLGDGTMEDRHVPVRLEF